jgi:hypothetical protein
MVSENKMILDSGDMVFVVGVVGRIQQFQNADFHERLLVVSRLIFDNLHRVELICTKMQAFSDLTERPTSQDVDNAVLIRRESNNIVYV